MPNPALLTATKIKFCGLCRPEDAAHGAAIGSDYSGVIFAPGKRTVTVETAREVLAAAPGTKRVGVFGLDSVPSVLSVAREADLDVLQLHGRFTAEDHFLLRQEFEGEIWSVISVDVESGALDENWRSFADAADALLLDSSVAGNTGGTGRPFNWGAAAASVHAVATEMPIILAGGLTPDNVAAAMHQLSPDVVDVSSGVERSPGVKDHDLMSAFALAVRSASIV